MNWRSKWINGNSLSTGNTGADMTAPTSNNGVTSPAARAMANIPPVTILGLAIGSTIFMIISNLVAPNAIAPFFSPSGTCLRPSSVDTITTGNVNNAIVNAAHNKPGAPKVGLGSVSEYSH